MTITGLVKKIAIFLLFVSANFIVHADSQSKDESVFVPQLLNFETEHKTVIRGNKINYKVVAGEIAIKNDSGEVTGHLFSTSYFRTNSNKNQTRPVTFLFNGGPGSSSVWLHMGSFAPKRVKVDSDASKDDGAAPYEIVNNPESLLDITDMVFIDPIGTGFSRMVGKGKKTDFWGLKADADSLAEFIRLWIGKYERWNSPKYIIGESYGSPRAAAITRALRKNGMDIALNGIVMISQAMDYTGSSPWDDNLIAYITYLPTYAALAHYHGKAGQDMSLKAFLEAVRSFAVDEYLPALFKGNLLSDDAKNNIADGLVKYTGLSKDFILRSNLRVIAARFRKELLREEGLTIGNNDGRYKLREIDQTAAEPRSDAASDNNKSAYSAALNHYFQSDLKVKLDRKYVLSNSAAGNEWDWTAIEPNPYGDLEYLNVSRIMSREMRRNKDLNVMVASGYYDLVTPFFDAQYTFARHGIPRKQVLMTYYPAGHMMYVHEPSFKKLSDDVREFYKQ